MDLEAVRTFIKVAELRSFTRAAEHIGLSKSRVALRVKALEEELGVRLLQRTTRSVHATPDGEQFLLRAQRLIEDADELGTMFLPQRSLRGQVRIDMAIGMARDVVIPRIPELQAQYPNIELQIGSTDRLIDLVRDGFDFVLRAGTVREPGLVAKRLGVMPMTNVASVDYIRTYGTPRTLEDLDRHLVVHYTGTFGTDAPTFEYRDGAKTVDKPMRATVTVNNVAAYHAACRAGLGIIQVPRSGVLDDLADRHLVEVLPEHVCAPLPVSLVYAEGRPLSRRVRVVMAWLSQLVSPRLA
ncbi:MAG TPA: LysR family transcriptional regulator [Kofleriaceae bacterium]|jgi:DNA-binding transcriptional LysR family regulator